MGVTSFDLETAMGKQYQKEEPRGALCFLSFFLLFKSVLFLAGLRHKTA